MGLPLPNRKLIVPRSECFTIVWENQIGFFSPKNRPLTSQYSKNLALPLMGDFWEKKSNRVFPHKRVLLGAGYKQFAIWKKQSHLWAGLFVIPFAVNH